MIMKFISFTISLLMVSFSFAQAELNVQQPINQMPPVQQINQQLAIQPPKPQHPVLIPQPPTIHAKAYLLMDANSGKILAQKNINEKFPPASLTKMMTMYLVSQALQSGSIQLDTQVPISKKAWKMGGSKMFIRVGKQVPVKNLIKGIIVDSGNDACVAMAEYLGGSEDSFVNLMNMTAQRLGMNNSHFQDCTGLPHPQHYSSAYDLAILSRAIIHNYPQHYQWYQQKWFTFNGIRQPNRNRLLWRYPYADGLKTGHTNKAGYCLVSSAIKDGMRLIAVVLGASSDESRANASISLLNYGFRFYETHLVYQGGTPIATPHIWFGKQKKLSIGVANNFYITTPRGQYQNIKASTQIPGDIKAPVEKGQTIGEVSVTLNNEKIASQPLIALQTIERGGIFRRSMDHVGHVMHNWFGTKKEKQPTPKTDDVTTNTADQQTTQPVSQAQ